MQIQMDFFLGFVVIFSFLEAKADKCRSDFSDFQSKECTLAKFISWGFRVSQKAERAAS